MSNDIFDYIISYYTWEELMLDTEDKLEMLSLIDVLVDGRFDQRYADGNHPFRGSSNQRIIDAQELLKETTLVTHMSN